MKKRKWAGITILLVLSVTTLVILSPGSSTNTNATAVEASTESSGTASMRAYLDPETGELTVGVMPAGELALDADTQNALRRDSEGLQSVRHADGSVSMDLQGRFQSVSVARVDENGKITMCSDNAAIVERSLDETIVQPATLEVK